MNNILEINLIDDTSKIDVNVIDNTSNIDVLLTDYNDKEIRDDIEELNQTKVDKVEGKGLTTNDFTDTDKNKLDNLENYDDTEVKRLINTKQDKLVSGGNIKTINNESILGSGNIDIQSGSSDHSELDNLDYEHSGHTGFQPAGNYIEDNDYVHTDNNYTNAEKQKLANLENYDDTEIRGSISDLDESKADKTEIPENTSDLNNDSGFITKNVNDLTYYTLKTSTGSLIDLEINQTTYVVTLSLKDQDGNVISSDSIDLPLENVVVSGSYDDSNQKIVLTLQNGTTVDIPVGDLVAGLQTEITSSNKIASDLVDDSNSGNKFVTTSEKTAWNSKYDKPSSGIPKTDLASSVQTSLGKADTALQSISSSDVTTALGYTPYNSTNPNGYTSNTGTITGVKMNGSTVASSGVADLGTVITEHQDISGKQDKIVAGTNISIASDGKTISATDTTYSNATTTTAGLMSSDDKTKLDGIETGATKDLNYYGTCATAAATQAKVVVCEGFALEEGATISVLFTNAQTYNGTPTLNVNSTGAKNIRYKADTNAVRYIWSAGEIIDFTYNGTYWVMHRSALATTSYYGLAKYSDSLVSTSSALGATPKAINTAMINIISGTPIYSTSSTYAVGDRVRYSNNVWECITAITTAEAWKKAHWQEVAPLQEQIDDKQDAITSSNKLSSDLVSDSNSTNKFITSAERTTWNSKQSLLVSGTNIKTINNQSILGSGNITIEGGGSGTVDTAMSDSSTNAVQNKVIKGYVDDIVGDIGTILDNINGEVIGG